MFFNIIMTPTLFLFGLAFIGAATSLASSFYFLSQHRLFPSGISILLAFFFDIILIIIFVNS